MFTDEIFLNNSEITRVGRRIGRYRFVQSNQSNKSEDEISKILEVATNKLTEISNPVCPTQIYDKKNDKTKIAIDIRNSSSINENQTIMEFVCEYKSTKEEYPKALVLKKLIY